MLRAGDDGKNSLVRVSNEPVGANCEQGGFVIQTGLDKNGNGQLGDNEVTGTSYACHGEQGVQGDQGSACDLRRYGVCRNADLRNLIILGHASDFTGIDLSGSDLRGAIIAVGQLDNANLSGRSSTGDDRELDLRAHQPLERQHQERTDRQQLRQHVLQGANLTNADFTDSIMDGVVLSDVNAAGAKFTRVDFDGGFGGPIHTVFDANFTGADFSDATNIGSFARCNLTNANFSRAGLGGGTFTFSPTDGSNLTGAIFDFATLIGRSFTNANASAAASFTNAYFDASTTGFDVASRGASI